jgi:hypothetical protein
MLSTSQDICINATEPLRLLGIPHVPLATRSTERTREFGKLRLTNSIDSIDLTTSTDVAKEPCSSLCPDHHARPEH